MATLNEYTDKTKKVIHLLVTTLCDRNCKYCCNKQYDLNAIPCVTDSELRACEIVCFTGGEPFKYANPNRLAMYTKTTFTNIKKVYVYTNGEPLLHYLRREKVDGLNNIDGLSIGVKNKDDAEALVTILTDFREYFDDKTKSNRVYIMNDIYWEENYWTISRLWSKLLISGLKENIFIRDWQEDFTPAEDSIFRRIKEIGG